MKEGRIKIGLLKMKEGRKDHNRFIKDEGRKEGRKEGRIKIGLLKMKKGRIKIDLLKMNRSKIKVMINCNIPKTIIKITDEILEELKESNHLEQMINLD